MAPEHVLPAESLWTWREVAAFLRIGRNAVYDLAARGELPSLRVGSRIRFVPAEVRAWLERQRGPDAPVLPLAKSAHMRKGDME